MLTNDELKSHPFKSRHVHFDALVDFLISFLSLGLGQSNAKTALDIHFSFCCLKSHSQSIPPALLVSPLSFNEYTKKNVNTSLHPSNFANCCELTSSLALNLVLIAETPFFQFSYKEQTSLEELVPCLICTHCSTATKGI